MPTSPPLTLREAVVVLKLDPANPYHLDPDENVPVAWLPKVGDIPLTTEHEFILCAIVTAFDGLHPQLAKHWREATAPVRQRWVTLQLEDTRPGMNDFHITSWIITGKEEHLVELLKACDRTDKRGLTAGWASNQLRKQSPAFDAAWLAMCKRQNQG